MGVDVGEVGGVREVAVEQPGEESNLDLWGKEGGDEVETYICQG